MIYNSTSNKYKSKEEIMVINYLEKIREKYRNELIELNLLLRKKKSAQRENVEIIKMLELNEDPSFESFSPRPVNSFNKKKILELNEEQKEIEQEIEFLKEKIMGIEKEIEEVTEVIHVAKECIL